MWEQNERGRPQAPTEPHLRYKTNFLNLAKFGFGCLEFKYLSSLICNAKFSLLRWDVWESTSELQLLFIKWLIEKIWTVTQLCLLCNQWSKQFGHSKGETSKFYNTVFTHRTFLLLREKSYPNISSFLSSLKNNINYRITTMHILYFGFY